jgi:hypothetical protein
LDFERWVQTLFEIDPRGRVPAWDELNGLPEQVLRRLTRLFRAPGFLLGRYEPRTIDARIAYLIQPVGSGSISVLWDTSLDWTARRACIDAIYDLFAGLFAPMYGDDIVCAPNGMSQADNYACFMFWDIAMIQTWEEGPDWQRVLDAAVDVMERQLTIPSLACQESALHGLGHYYRSRKTRCQDIVIGYLQRDGIPPALRRYAVAASSGNVL